MSLSRQNYSMDCLSHLEPGPSPLHVADELIQFCICRRTPASATVCWRIGGGGPETLDAVHIRDNGHQLGNLLGGQLAPPPLHHIQPLLQPAAGQLLRPLLLPAVGQLPRPFFVRGVSFPNL